MWIVVATLVNDSVLYFGSYRSEEAADRALESVQRLYGASLKSSRKEKLTRLEARGCTDMEMDFQE